MAKIRGTHSSPGIYTQITDISYAAKSLGITTLGLVGETTMGPAFEPIPITSWDEFTSYFGGTNAEIFSDSKYPKYELPYIAKSYLSASDQLYVCRVLGLSGYNAGPAWILTAEGIGDTKYVIGVLRARGSYSKYGAGAASICEGGGDAMYDVMSFDCDRVLIQPYTNIYVATQCEDADPTSFDEDEIALSYTDNGKFKLIAQRYIGTTQTGDAEYETVGSYSVSLNAGNKDYIYNVLGGSPSNGSAAIYIEELFDLRLKELIDNDIVTNISMPNYDESENCGIVDKINMLKVNAVADPVSDFVSVPYTELSKKQLAQSYLCDMASEDFMYYKTDSETGKPDVSQLLPMQVGGIYTVKNVQTSNGTKEYAYVDACKIGIVDDMKVYIPAFVGKIQHNVSGYDTVDGVKVVTYNSFFHMSSNDTIVEAISMSDYYEEFRCASTPWFVSELKGDGKMIDVKKLFRFHTISDGSSANALCKVSIANVRPEEGTFDVYIRDYSDSDNSPIILESYRGLTMRPGDAKYIGLKIGTLDGSYESKSKFVMVEVIENEITSNSVPCGFLGYPIRDFEAMDVNYVSPTFVYNTEYNEEIKDKKQYFGLSDITGVDLDILNYKGRTAYTGDFRYGYTRPFHLDATVSPEIAEATGIQVTIDGDINTASIAWSTVSPAYSSKYESYPVISTEAMMAGTLYEKVNLRKFTAYFYGGFDGWDIYRGSRTNTDDFKANRYKGKVSFGKGETFSKVDNCAALALDSGAITSDYYAYLAGINQFEIPERYAINLFATPGIDYVNNPSLVSDVVSMIEDKRMGDTFYVVTTPDKPFGATDARDEMYTSSEVSDNLEDTGIDSYYAATYYPWIKYYDADNKIYVNLPATKDALRNMANVDNKKYPWYAPAGVERGNVQCTRMHFFAKLEDEDNVYDGRINPLKTFSEDGVKIWGNKTMYTGDTPMNRINVVRLMIYMRKLIIQASRKLIFDQNDTTLKTEFENILTPILTQIKNDRGITAFKLQVSQTAEEMDAHEMNCTLMVKPTPTLEYIGINFVVTPQGVDFETL